MVFSHLKKSLSVLLCAVMLASCWVFAAPQAEAAAKDLYSYEIQITTTNKADCNDEGVYPSLLISGKTKNGKADGSEPIEQVNLDYDDIQKEQTFTCTGSSNKFPTDLTLSIYFDAGAFTTRRWEGKFSMKVNGTTILNDSSSRRLEGGSMFNRELKSLTVSVPSTAYPEVQQISFTKKPPTTVTVPRTDEALFTCDVAVEMVDQYGVLWYEQPSLSFETFHSGVTINDGTFQVTSDANTANGSNSSVKLNATYDVYSQSVTVNLINATYHYEFQDLDGSTIASGNLRYGQSIPLPADLTKASDRSNHYIFQGWSPNADRLQRDTVFKPDFKQEAHQFLTYTSDRNATCTKDGTKTSVCTCGVEKTVTDEGSVLGHSYSYAITKQPGCTEAGEMTYTCSRCGDAYTTQLNPTGHSYTSQTVAPTCEQKGYTLYTCGSCGEQLRENYVDALGHNWDGGTVQKAAGCTTAGTMVYTCSRCAGTYSEEIEPLGHSFKTWTIRRFASCEEDGERFSKCSRCQQVITQTLPAYGHSWSDWVEEQAPTCEEQGTKLHSCLICGKENREPIDALDHKMVEVVKAPKDGKDGMIYYQCSRKGCDKCATCVINAQGEREVGEICEAEELPASTVDIPTATFNTYNSVEDHYNYINRGASLRIDTSAPMDTQALRFSSSVLLPQGVTILDYGYVLTTEDYFQTINDLVIDGAGVVKTSVINGKHTAHQTEQGEVQTYNMVLVDIAKQNWGKQYIARPYIIYRYAGEVFTVYDGMYSARSVNYIAAKVLQSPTERQWVKDYIQNKIFA